MNEAVACPSHLLMTAVGTPRRCINVPHVCRASWSLEMAAWVLSYVSNGHEIGTEPTPCDVVATVTRYWHCVYDGHLTHIKYQRYVREFLSPKKGHRSLDQAAEQMTSSLPVPTPQKPGQASAVVQLALCPRTTSEL